MSDKKVDRSRPDRTINPTHQTTSSLSERGTVNMAESTHDKGKSALVDKFRKREERWRREQSLHDREAAGTSSATSGQRQAEEKAVAEGDASDEGGAR